MADITQWEQRMNMASGRLRAQSSCNYQVGPVQPGSNGASADALDIRVVDEAPSEHPTTRPSTPSPAGPRNGSNNAAALELTSVSQPCQINPDGLQPTSTTSCVVCGGPHAQHSSAVDAYPPPLSEWDFSDDATLVGSSPIRSSDSDDTVYGSSTPDRA